jgi:hypothetical protein
MSRLLKTILALAVALTMTMSPVLGKNLGVFQNEDRNMDFQFSTCGESKKELCAKLIAVRGGAKTSKTIPYVGKYVMRNAKPTGKNAWRGTIVFRDYELGGSIKLNPGKSVVLTGCIYVVVCDDLILLPKKKKSP